MKKTVTMALAGCLAVGLASMPWLLHGAEPAKAAPGDKPAADRPADRPATDEPAANEPALDLRDPAFDKFVDLKLLTRAAAEGDPSALADAGLQLAEGERVLLRQRKGFSAEKVLELASQAAADKNDKATLDRLARAAEALNNKDLGDKVAAARKLAGGTRAADPALSVSVEGTTPEAFAMYKDWVDRIKAARLTGDKAALDQIAKQAPELDKLTDLQRKYLVKSASDAVAVLPAEGDAKDATALALSKLVAASRAPRPRPPQRPVPVPPSNPNATRIGVLPSGNDLGVQAHWDYASGGYLIDYVDPNGEAAGLPDGNYLEAGDVIVQVGSAPASPNRQLQGLLQAAEATGNRFISVVDVNSGVSSFHPF